MTNETVCGLPRRLFGLAVANKGVDDSHVAQTQTSQQNTMRQDECLRILFADWLYLV